MHMHDYYREYSMVLKAVPIIGARRAVVITCVVIAALSGCRTGIDHRISRAYALARRPTEPNKARIEALLRDEDRDVRATALVVMGNIDSDRARKMAVTALSDPDGLVRAAAVPLCSDGVDPGTIGLITARATDDPVWQVRARALEAIASSEDPAVRDAFVRALSDSVRHVRRAALRAGIEHPGLLSVELVNSLVTSDPDWENRVEAAIVLGTSKDPAAYTGLDAAVGDSNEFVRTTASRERRDLERAGIPRVTGIPGAGV
jgi:HEAT repeat protein